MATASMKDIADWMKKRNGQMPPEFKEMILSDSEAFKRFVAAVAADMREEATPFCFTVQTGLVWFIDNFDESAEAIARLLSEIEETTQT